MLTLMAKPKQQNLRCPFCEATSTRGTGLSAHVRARHPRQYKNWNRNPNRLVEAADAAATPKAEPEKNRRVRHMPPAALVEPRPDLVAPQKTQSPAAKPQHGEPNGNEALSLLQKVHDQLAARKDSIESEMARVEALRSEHESVVTQLAAIDQAMSAFRRP
jgi:hypothetical protein